VVPEQREVANACGVTGLEEHITDGLENVGEGLTDMLRGSVFGKPVVTGRPARTAADGAPRAGVRFGSVPGIRTSASEASGALTASQRSWGWSVAGGDATEARSRSTIRGGTQRTESSDGFDFQRTGRGGEATPIRAGAQLKYETTGETNSRESSAQIWK
jgi:hypothetical protein